MKPETAAALKQIDKNGFLDIDLDPTLDLFAAIERLKKEKNAVLLASTTRNRIFRMWQIISAIAWVSLSRLRKQMLI